MKNDADILRESIKILMRNLGVLESKKAFCCECTYAQCHALVEIADEKVISLNDLTSALKINKSAASRTVDELLHKGYITREQDPDDRRYVKIALTPDGWQMHKQIESSSREKFNMVLSEIPEEKRQAALDGLRIVADAIQKSTTTTETKKCSC